jgi:hypothetical protein
MLRSLRKVFGARDGNAEKVRLRQRWRRVPYLLFACTSAVSFMILSRPPGLPAAGGGR